MHLPDWKLPRGVSRSLWEFAHDPQIVTRETEHLAGSSVHALDEQLVQRWFPAPGPLIDLGCGTGRHLAAFVTRRFPALGVDLSQDSLVAAREKIESTGTHPALLRANLCELHCLPPASFDYALLMFGTLGMVEGAANRRAVLDHAARLLRPGGRIALHVHSIWRHLCDPHGRSWLLKDRLKKLLGDPTAGDTRHDYRGIPGMYHHVFTRREILTTLRQTGFQVREIVPVPPPQQEYDSPFSPSRHLVSGWILLAERRA